MGCTSQAEQFLFVAPSNPFARTPSEKSMGGEKQSLSWGETHMEAHHTYYQRYKAVQVRQNVLNGNGHKTKKRGRMQNSCPIFLLISLQIHTFATGKPIEEVLAIALPPRERP